MYAARPSLMDLILPDGSEIEARAYREADDEALIKDNTRFLIPLRSTARSSWPAQVVGVEGLQIRLERSPRLQPATAHWSAPEELPKLWPVARLALRGLPRDPPPNAGIVVVDLTGCGDRGGG